MRKQLITAAILAAFAGAPQFASAADDAKKNMTGTEMKAATVSATRLFAADHRFCIF